MSDINLTVALEQFHLRKADNAKLKHVDNASLPAGAPMYYYCRFCGCHTDTLAESSWSSPITICVPCKILHEHGLLPVRPA